MTQIPANTSADTAGTRHPKIAAVQPALRLAEEDWKIRRVERSQVLADPFTPATPSYCENC